LLYQLSYLAGKGADYRPSARRRQSRMLLPASALSLTACLQAT